VLEDVLVGILPTCLVTQSPRRRGKNVLEDVLVGILPTSGHSFPP